MKQKCSSKIEQMDIQSDGKYIYPSKNSPRFLRPECPGCFFSDKYGAKLMELSEGSGFGNLKSYYIESKHWLRFPITEFIHSLWK